MIDRIQFSTGPAVGANAVATATGFSSHTSGLILAVHVTYEDTPPGTTDFTLQDAQDPANENIVTLANAAADIKIYPRRILEQNDGTDLLYAGAGEEVYGYYAVHGRLEATIAQANADDSVTVVVWLLKSWPM